MACESCQLILLLIIGAVTAFYLFFKKKFTYWKDRGVTYLEPKIPFGNLRMDNKPTNLRLIINKFYEKKDRSPFVGGYFFFKPVVVATDLDFVKNVLVKDFNNFHDRGVYYNEKDDPLSAHMFALDGNKWRSLRSKLTPTFTSGKMKFMFSTIVDVAEEFRQTLFNIVETPQELELKDLIARFTTDVIGTCAFGIECNSLKDPNAEFRVNGRKFLENPKFHPVFLSFVMQFQSLSKKLHITMLRKDVSEFFMRIVRETIDYREKNNIRRNDFMDLLIQLKNNKTLEGDEKTQIPSNLSVEEIAAQAFVFFIAGFETSSTAMSFALYELALNQDIQEKARKEINDCLEKNDGLLTYEVMMNMTYIDQIVSESLRKYPPVNALVRKTNNDYKVPNTNIIIEKGTRIFIPAYSIHHDPEIYSDPEKFDPDRFSPEQIHKRHPMAFLGFGDGPRNCVGLRFGRMQSRIGLIMLLKNFRFTTSEKTLIPMKFALTTPILTSEGGLWLKVEKV